MPIKIDIGCLSEAKMKDYRGMYIQQIRKEKDISMEALSHGICSISYLSKIENNEVNASDEIINLLLKKLNIEIIENESLKEVGNLLTSFFELLFEYDLKIYDVVDKLTFYDGKLFGSPIYLDYELFKMYAKEVCGTVFDSYLDLSDYISFMNKKQKDLYSIYMTWTQQNSELKIDKNIQLFLLKGQAGNELKNRNNFKSYDLLKEAYNIAIEKCNLISVCDILMDMAWTSFPDLCKVEECYSKILDIVKQHLQTKVKKQYEAMIYYNYSVFLLMDKNYIEAEKKFKLGYKRIKCMDKGMKQRFLERYIVCEKKLNKDTKFLLDELNIVPNYLLDEINLYHNLKSELKERKNDIFIHYLFKEICIETNHWKEAYEQECYFSQKKYIE
jgi:transcriptional regulator with XRE-family HTH domain